MADEERHVVCGGRPPWETSSSPASLFLSFYLSLSLSLFFSVCVCVCVYFVFLKSALVCLRRLPNRNNNVDRFFFSFFLFFFFLPIFFLLFLSFIRRHFLESKLGLQWVLMGYTGFHWFFWWVTLGSNGLHLVFGGLY